jgi:hypothetical protein
MRLINRTASLLLAVSLLGGGLLIAAEAALAALRRPPLLIARDQWYHALTTTRLGDPAVRTVALAATLCGLLILLAQLRRWRPDRLGVRLGDGWHLQRRSVERRLANTADEVRGVTKARARIRGRAMAWRPRIHAVGDPSARPAIELAVRRELDRLAAPATERVRVELVRDLRAR